MREPARNVTCAFGRQAHRDRAGDDDVAAVEPAIHNARNAAFAAKYPHIPCTPPPGGVDDEQM